MNGGPGLPEGFEPTPAAAQQRLQAVRPHDYARTRNHLEGAVTRLSPYLTHGLLTVPQVLQHLAEAHGLDARHKLVYELGWREYFRHVWRHEGEAILASLRPGPRPDAAYARALPDDLRQGRTGVPAIDEAVHTLYTTGWLHNHARMWLASYTVHLRHVHWRAGADWMFGHLLDGDLASNHLSWQWVAGTASQRPYLFNADNVARFAPAAWRSAGTVLDAPYETLEALARHPDRMPPVPAAAAPALMTATEPALYAAPPQGGFTAADAACVADRDVWLVHPWSLADPPAGCWPVAVCDATFHRCWPWSARRWQFVATRMAAVATLRWYDEPAALVAALAAARSVRGLDDPHLGADFAPLGLAPPAAAFTEPGRRCRSFSGWWARVQVHDALHDAPLDPARSTGRRPPRQAPAG